MIFDGSGDLFQQKWRDWLVRKTIEFNGFFPAITVTPIDVPFQEMLNEAEEDLESGRNTFDAYIIPLMNVQGGTSRLADRLMDLSTFTVANVNDIAWHTIGRYFRAYSALYDGQVLTLPLAGDFVSLYYRADVFTMYGMAVPRTLEEYVRASQALNGTDMNGDGEPDYGSCMEQEGAYSGELFLTWIVQTLQFRGTSQGGLFDTDTLTPLLANPAVQESIRLWKQIAGPPTKTEGTTTEELVTFWTAGRCAMTISPSIVYTAFQNFPFQGTIGTAMMPGSEKVWSRETQETAVCNKSFCRHATEYPDGLVVNHAPFGQSFLDGAVNGQVERSKQLAAYTYLTWLMNDGNMLEALVNPPSFPNFFAGSMVRPAVLVPSVWMPYGWSDPGLSSYCATQAANIEHSNAYIGLRLPTSLEYLAAVKEILVVFLRDEGEFEDLDAQAGAVAASVSLTAALQDVTRRGDRNALISIYQRSLNIYVSKQAATTARRAEVFPPWAVYAVVGMLSIAACIFFFVFACWLTSTVRQRRRLRAKQQSAWEEILDGAEAYTTSLSCPMALVSTTDFLDLERLVKFEDLREQGRLRVLDTIDKVLEFRKKFLVMYVSHQWCAWSVPDPNGVHYRTICASVRTFAQVAHVSVDEVFLWVDFCCIPQDRCHIDTFRVTIFVNTHHGRLALLCPHQCVLFRHTPQHPRNTWPLVSSSLQQFRCTCPCATSSLSSHLQQHTLMCGWGSRRTCAKATLWKRNTSG